MGLTPLERQGGCRHREKCAERCVRGENERELRAQGKSRGKQEGAAHAGEITRLYLPLEHDPPCSSPIERGKGKRGDRRREDDGCSTWNAPAPSALQIRGSCFCSTAFRPLLHHPIVSSPSDLCCYALSRTPCFRFYMGSVSPSSACFPASRPGPAPFT